MATGNYSYWKNCLTMIRAGTGITVDNSNPMKPIINATGGGGGGSENTTTLGALINGATAKATPVDADMLPLMDSAGSNIVKKLSWDNLKATLKSYFDTLSTVLTNKTISGASNTLSNISADSTIDGTTNKVFTATEKTKLAGIEAAADVTDAANVAAAGAVMEADTSTASMGFVIDEDDMSSDSATKVPTQQSVKAYVLANAGGGLPFKTIMWTVYADGTDESDIHYTIHYNDTGRNLLVSSAGIELDGLFTKRFYLTIPVINNSGGSIYPIPLSESKIGLVFEEGATSLNNLTGSVESPLRLKIEIYE